MCICMCMLLLQMGRILCTLVWTTPMCEYSRCNARCLSNNLRQHGEVCSPVCRPHTYIHTYTHYTQVHTHTGRMQRHTNMSRECKLLLLINPCQIQDGNACGICKRKEVCSHAWKSNIKWVGALNNGQRAWFQDGKNNMQESGVEGLGGESPETLRKIHTQEQPLSTSELAEAWDGHTWAPSTSGDGSPLRILGQGVVEMSALPGSFCTMSQHWPRRSCHGSGKKLPWFANSFWRDDHVHRWCVPVLQWKVEEIQEIQIAPHFSVAFLLNTQFQCGIPSKYPVSVLHSH